MTSASPTREGACDHEGQCVLLSVWAEVGDHMRTHLDGFTIADMVHRVAGPSAASAPQALASMPEPVGAVPEPVA